MKQFANFPRWRLAVFLAANVVVAALLWVVLIAPVRAYLGSETDAIDAQGSQLRRLQAVAARQGEVEAFAQKVRQEAAKGEFLAGDNDGLVNANLQARLKQVAEGAGASVRSLRSLSGRSLSGASLVGARLEVSGTIKSVHAALAAIEGGNPVLFVPTAIMRPALARLSLAEEPTIDAQFDVFGAARIAEAK